MLYSIQQNIPEVWTNRSVYCMAFENDTIQSEIVLILAANILFVIRFKVWSSYTHELYYVCHVFILISARFYLRKYGRSVTRLDVDTTLSSGGNNAFNYIDPFLHALFLEK